MVGDTVLPYQSCLSASGSSAQRRFAYSETPQGAIMEGLRSLLRFRPSRRQLLPRDYTKTY